MEAAILTNGHDLSATALRPPVPKQPLTNPKAAERQVKKPRRIRKPDAPELTSAVKPDDSTESDAREQLIGQLEDIREGLSYCASEIATYYADAADAFARERNSRRLDFYLRDLPTPEVEHAGLVGYVENAWRNILDLAICARQRKANLFDAALTVVGRSAFSSEFPALATAHTKLVEEIDSICGTMERTVTLMPSSFPNEVMIEGLPPAALVNGVIGAAVRLAGEIARILKTRK